MGMNFRRLCLLLKQRQSLYDGIPSRRLGTRYNIQEFQQFRENIGREAQERGLTEDKLNKLLSNDQ
jgi:hypothetical protein